MFDANGDGALDMASGNRNSADVSVVLGDGCGEFEPQERFQVGTGQLATHGYPHDLATGDLDGDGVDDIATANLFDFTVGVLLSGS